MIVGKNPYTFFRNSLLFAWKFVTKLPSKIAKICNGICWIENDSTPPLPLEFFLKIHPDLRLHSSLRLATKCDFKYCDQIKPVVWMLATLGINEGELVEAKPKKFGQLWKVMFQRNFLCQPKVGPLVQLGFVCRIYPRQSGTNLSLISSSHWTLQTDTRTHTCKHFFCKSTKTGEAPFTHKVLEGPWNTFEEHIFNIKTKMILQEWMMKLNSYTLNHLFVLWMFVSVWFVFQPTWLTDKWHNFAKCLLMVSTNRPIVCHSKLLAL